MVGIKQVNLRAQRGVSLSGLIVLLAIIGMVAVLAMKVFPTFIEYRAVKNAIVAGKASGGTPKEIKDSFNRNADINNVTALTGKDLIITKDTGETQVAFAYDKDIELFTNVKLVIHYQGTTDPTGKIPEKPPAEPTR